LPPLRSVLGLLNDAGDGFEDLIDVGEDDDVEKWITFQEVTYRWRRNEQGQWGVFPGGDQAQASMGVAVRLGRRALPPCLVG
jgi:hypothetical protein